MADQNLDFLSPVGFQLGIVKLPGVGFKTQECTIPGITLPEATFTTPFTDVPEPGDKMQWEPFVIKFMVDENMQNYLAVWSWIISLGFPNSYEEFLDGANRQLIHKSDGFLQILGSNNTIVKTVKMSDMFPTSLSAVSFTSTDIDVQYIQATAEFRYSTFKFE